MEWEGLPEESEELRGREQDKVFPSVMTSILQCCTFLSTLTPEIIEQNKVFSLLVHDGEGIHNTAVSEDLIWLQIVFFQGTNLFSWCQLQKLQIQNVCVS